MEKEEQKRQHEKYAKAMSSVILNGYLYWKVCSV